MRGRCTDTHTEIERERKKRERGAILTFGRQNSDGNDLVLSIGSDDRT